METIKEQQDADNNLQRQAIKYADRYIRKSITAVGNIYAMLSQETLRLTGK
jgi:hypothetical protein